MTDPRTQLVAAGYDRMPDAWESFRAGVRDDPRVEWLELLLARVPHGAPIVELGCGNGTGETAALARHGRLVAVDLSTEQLRRARARVPEAEYVHADLTAVEFEAGSVAAVAAFYVLNHVPRELLPALFRRIHAWLCPGGSFLASLGVGDTEGWTGEWLGVEMFFSSHLPDMNVRLLREAGFVVERESVVTIAEPEGPAAFHWVLACR